MKNIEVQQRIRVETNSHDPYDGRTGTIERLDEGNKQAWVIFDVGVPQWIDYAAIRAVSPVPSQ